MLGEATFALAGLHGAGPGAGGLVGGGEERGGPEGRCWAQRECSLLPPAGPGARTGTRTGRTAAANSRRAFPWPCSRLCHRYFKLARKERNGRVVRCCACRYLAAAAREAQAEVPGQAVQVPVEAPRAGSARIAGAIRANTMGGQCVPPRLRARRGLTPQGTRQGTRAAGRGYALLGARALGTAPSTSAGSHCAATRRGPARRPVQASLQGMQRAAARCEHTRRTGPGRRGLADSQAGQTPSFASFASFVCSPSASSACDPDTGRTRRPAARVSCNAHPPQTLAAPAARHCQPAAPPPVCARPSPTGPDVDRARPTSRPPSMAAPAAQSQQLGSAMLGFALDGKFPDDVAELPPVSDLDLQPAIDSLARAKTELEVRPSLSPSPRRRLARQAAGSHRPGRHTRHQPGHAE